jgi:hypothetical protein
MQKIMTSLASLEWPDSYEYDRGDLWRANGHGDGCRDFVEVQVRYLTQ